MNLLLQTCRETVIKNLPIKKAATLKECNSNPMLVKPIYSPGPMSKIRCDSRVRARGFISKIRVRGIARVRGDSSNTSGSDS